MKGGPAHQFPKTHMRPERPAPKPDRDRDLMEVDDEERGRGRYESNNRHAEADYQDGRYGFSETPENNGSNGRRDARGGREEQGLFSDSMIRRDRDRNYHL